MKRDNFFCYRNILSIDPGYSSENGTGYAIFDDDNHRLRACGIIRPFASGLESHASTIEIANKVRKIWEQEVGFSYDPKILCIEHPLACFTRQGVRINSKSIVTLAILCVRIEERFSAKTVLRPYPYNWKKRDSKEQTKALVLDSLNQCSLNVLERGILAISQGIRHNVFDAVGLGLWAINQKNYPEEPKKNGLNQRPDDS